MMRRRSIEIAGLSLPFAATFVLLSVAACDAHEPGPAAAATEAQDVRGLEPGQRPPDFVATDIAGTTHSLADYAKQRDVVLLHFWATWCPYCRAEIPKLKKIQQERPEVKIVSVSVDEDPAKVRAYLQQNPLPYPVIIEAEQDHPLSSTFEVQGIPATYIIDRQGLVANHFQGQADLDSAIRRMIGESAQAP